MIEEILEEAANANEEISHAEICVLLAADMFSLLEDHPKGKQLLPRINEKLGIATKALRQIQEMYATL